MTFKNKIILITGASRGIGEDIAKTFSLKEAKIVGISTNEKGVKKINKMGKNVYGIKANINNKEDIIKIIEWMKYNIGMPDILINNAGIIKDCLIIRMSENNWDNVINTNLKSIFMLSKSIIPSMMKKKWGRIINIGSIIGSIGNAGQTNYSSSKAGLIGFSKSLALEIASRNITVNTISPGFIQTDMIKNLTELQKQKIIKNIPLKRIGIPSDISNIVIFLASEKSNYITGQNIHINGGMYMC